MGELALRDIVKSFGHIEVVKRVSLDVSEGEFVVFVGPSGCGKSTLLRMIAGLEHTTSGDIKIDGARVNDLPPVKRGIAMVFQSYALYPHMSVYENIAFPLRVEKANEDAIRNKVEHAARILHLDQRLQQKPGMLSGGQRQRVAIGRAIVREPKIFLFDEPLSNLDAELRVQMRVEITTLHRDLGNTMIYVTHDQVEAMTMADKIVVLNGGNIEQVGAPLELYNHPVNRFVAGFIGSPKMNFLEGSVAAREPGTTVLKVGGEEVRLPRDIRAAAGDPVTLGVRPEHLTPDPGAGVRLVEARVDLIEHLGGETVLHARAPDGQSLTLSLDGQQKVAAGDLIPVCIDPERCHVFGADGLAL